ncbi:hypothetical protein B2G69_07040 [Methylorubrum zatmanii]|nr:hypothetical protein [Methylorubrum zatmanii]ARO53929.1 hypothetical protein B2G69_07040 [Methylorubrum zatmanii]
MPVFFFDVRWSRGLEADETGLDLASAEVAYLEACKAIPDLTVELMRMGDNPRDYSFEVADEAGRVLWRIPFTEPFH